MSEPGAEDRLREEVAALPVEELLALCYAFQNKSERLRLYLDVLRKRGGGRAQFSCCLICFDLARQGDATSQQEFPYLADTMRDLAANQEMVDDLIGDDQYLSFIWELCSAQLEEMDARVDAHHVDHREEDVASFDLLGDDDFADFQIDVDAARLHDEFEMAVDQFLGLIPGMPVYDPEAGYRMKHKRDTERMETFLQALDSFRDPVPMARGFRALTNIFYGTRMRSKSLFGAVNERKQALLRAGVEEFVQSGAEMSEIVGVLSPAHADDNAWPKVADIILDYLRFWSRRGDKNPPLSFEYDVIGRLVKRDSGRRKHR